MVADCAATVPESPYGVLKVKSELCRRSAMKNPKTIRDVLQILGEYHERRCAKYQELAQSSTDPRANIGRFTTDNRITTVTQT